MNAPMSPQPSPAWVMTSSSAALTSYVGRHQQAVYKFCYWALGEAGQAQTMTQDVFAEACTRPLPAAGVGETVHLLRIAYRCCKHTLGRDHAVEHPGKSEGLKVLAMAPAESRCLLILHVCCGLTPEEVALVTGLSPDEIRQRLLRARRTIASRLAVADLVHLHPQD